MRSSRVMMLVVFLVACGGGDDGGGGGSGVLDAPASTGDAANNTAVCNSFCAILARCNAEDPGMWDSCSTQRQNECLAANTACATAIDAFNDCANPTACSDIPSDCTSEMNAVTSACGF